ncbi:sodium:dicarboxylate symporter [Pontibacillus halophilus JSM 076056 = DSM 19796]|uniref:Sodium:dicarboxylate symporter n=1 Tax=Pontibacillus halophilus JSM 076056 = DSM 19796 TaxID=1385510 RepID=A0A0A5GP57_9BACI|nr:dicarboxylate/amino acid:cation symporter [Pontibacillus halophilus]KGX92955.1 sodium:dicarboxylate symporter [Pontibacillus halophilus JSM 076056 = DSM 19796]
MSLTKKILLGLALGVLLGLGLSSVDNGIYETVSTWVLYPIGQLFVNLIKMLVVPIVFVSLVLGTSGISDPKKLGRIGFKTVLFFLTTTAIALTLALGAGALFEPGSGANMTLDQEFEASEAPSVAETLLNIIPSNPLQAMVEGEMLQVIAFSIFVGFALSRIGEKGQMIHRFFEQANDLLMYLVQAIMKFAPYGAFALIADAIGSQGGDALLNMVKYLLVVLLVLLVHLLVTYGSAIALLGKMNPFDFFKKFSPAMAVAFSTSSSSGTLPVSMKTVQEKLNVPKSVSGFVQPLGATINMDGTAIMQGVATMFIAQMYGESLAFGDLLTVVLTATLASIGTAGAPGVGLIMLSMVLTSVGLPVEAISLVLAVDRLIDMCRTSVNVTGDAAAAVIIARSERGKETDIPASESYSN